MGCALETNLNKSINKKKESEGDGGGGVGPSTALPAVSAGRRGRLKPRAAHAGGCRGIGSAQGREGSGGPSAPMASGILGPGMREGPAKS